MTSGLFAGVCEAGLSRALSSSAGARPGIAVGVVVSVAVGVTVGIAFGMVLGIDTSSLQSISTKSLSGVTSLSRYILGDGWRMIFAATSVCACGLRSHHGGRNLLLINMVCGGARRLFW